MMMMMMMMMMSISPFGHKDVGDLFRGQRDVFTSITLASTDPKPEYSK
jgi:hypothetical protein